MKTVKVKNSIKVKDFINECRQQDPKLSDKTDDEYLKILRQMTKSETLGLNDLIATPLILKDAN